MISPLAFVIDVHPFFALAIRRNHGAIRFDGCLVEERIRLLRPDAEASLVNDPHQRQDVAKAEAAAEIAGRCRIGNASRAQGVQICFVIAA